MKFQSPFGLRRTPYRIVFAAVITGLLAVPLLAKHPTNPGPADPPIRFHLPPPKPLSAEEAIQTFKLPPGFRIECVVSEPMVEDPIFACFDADARIWVVEFRGYMHDLEGAGENQPLGRIKILESTRGDGKYDKATIFLDSLIMPRAVLPTRGGALVGVPPELAFWKEVDGVATQKTIVATDFGRKGGQPESMANGLLPGLDNWIHNAAHTSRYRFQRGKWVSETARTRGQWGVSQDDYGRLYYCTNTDLARVDPFPNRYFTRNPYFKATAADNVELMPFSEQDVWPGHPTPGTNRGYTATELRDDGTLSRPTAACGDTIYRGDLFPAEFRNNLFTCEPVGNLVKRMLIAEYGGRLIGRHAYDKVDFLTSTDERFRPVTVTTGPDGALYVVDMYRGVIEHAAFLTNYLLKNIKERHLEMPIHMGRIYRVVTEGATPRPVKFPKDGPGLVQDLAHSSGWVRDMAQRLLVEKSDAKVVPLLETMAAGHSNPLARLHALYTLEGMGRLDGAVALKATADADPHVRVAAIRLSEPLLVPATRAQALPEILKLLSDTQPDVQLQLALTLSAVPDAQAEAGVAKLLSSSTVASEIVRDCVISGLRGRELDFLQRLLAKPEWAKESADSAGTLRALAQCVFAEHHTSAEKRLLDIAAAEPEGSWRQLELLHGMLPITSSLKTSATTRLATTRTTQPSVPIRLIYLDSEPTALAGLLRSENREVRSMTTRVDARLAWPGKPGVPERPKVIPLTTIEQTQFERGKVVYSQICITCHQATGLGQDGLAPPLVDSEWVLGSDHRLARIVLQGLNGPISVAGSDYRLEMPALATIPDEDIAAALTYVRREWEHSASAVSAETVTKIREETKSRADLWTAKELLEVK
jgi:mono/diheme cytochrome c family protein